MSAAAQLSLRYPWFSNPENPRYVAAELRDAALTAAVSYRPACLPPHMQDEAQAHYAAYLLSSQPIAAGNGVEAAAAGIVKSETEGGVSRTYMTAAEAGVSSVGVVNVAKTPWDEYERLAKICRMGAVVVSPVVPVRPWP